MKRVLLFSCFAFLLSWTQAQDISIRVRPVAFSAADPDGAGPATGSVTISFELKSSSTEVLADGMGLSFVFQSAALMATPQSLVEALGPINTPQWKLQAENRAGNAIAPVRYGGQMFDRRMIISFNQNSGVPDAPIGSQWTAVAKLTYYTLGNFAPQGGYIVPEPGTIVAQNELSSDGGLSTYPLLSPELQTPLALSATGTLPVQFSFFEARCSGSGTQLVWRTATEKDNSHFEVEKSSDGRTWTSIGQVKGKGNSNSETGYSFTDDRGGDAAYRIRQVDLEGRASYSSVVRTACAARNLLVNLYPVPARDKLNLVIGSDKELMLSLQVVDNAGRVVIQVPFALHTGTNKLTLDVSRLPQGQYYLRSRGKALDIDQRFTITR